MRLDQTIARGAIAVGVPLGLLSPLWHLTVGVHGQRALT
jgi:hypothetical protein